VFGVTAIIMPTTSDTWQDRIAVVNWLGKRFLVKLSLPRDALGVAIFDNEGFAHLTVFALDPCFGVAKSNCPDMPTAGADGFVLFHPIILALHNSG
jgi:hypothetical protein